MLFWLSFSNISKDFVFFMEVLSPETLSMLLNMSNFENMFFFKYLWSERRSASIGFPMYDNYFMKNLFFIFYRFPNNETLLKLKFNTSRLLNCSIPFKLIRLLLFRYSLAIKHKDDGTRSMILIFKVQQERVENSTSSRGLFLGQCSLSIE